MYKKAAGLNAFFVLTVTNYSGAVMGQIEQVQRARYWSVTTRVAIVLIITKQSEAQ